MEGRCEFYASSTGYAYDNYYNEVSMKHLSEFFFYQLQSIKVQLSSPMYLYCLGGGA